MQTLYLFIQISNLNYFSFNFIKVALYPDQFVKNPIISKLFINLIGCVLHPCQSPSAMVDSRVIGRSPSSIIGCILRLGFLQQVEHLLQPQHIAIRLNSLANPMMKNTVSASKPQQVYWQQSNRLVWIMVKYGWYKWRKRKTS